MLNADPTEPSGGTRERVSDRVLYRHKTGVFIGFACGLVIGAGFTFVYGDYGFAVAFALQLMAFAAAWHYARKAK